MKKTREEGDADEEDPDDTDDEEIDIDVVRERRRANKQEILEMIRAKMGEPVPTSTSLYQPDERSKTWAMQYFIHPLLLQNPGY